MAKYIIKPSKRQELLDYTIQNYNGVECTRRKEVVLENKPKSYLRWTKWFKLDVLDEVLMEEDCEEIVIEPNEHTNIQEEIVEDSNQMEVPNEEYYENLGI